MPRLIVLSLVLSCNLPAFPVVAQTGGTAEPPVLESQPKTTKPSDKQTQSARASNREQQASPASAFLRLREEADQPMSLDTAVVTYRSREQDLRVDLIGAVHVGEASYYQRLNELFDDYDVLLYELVAEEGTVIPKGGPRQNAGFNPVAMLQDGTKNMLGLESQLEHIDYTKPHFIRADLTPKQIAAKMAERGDSAWTLALDTLADAMRQQQLAAQNPPNAALAELEDVRLSDVFGNPLKMKRLLAAQFAASGSLDQALGDSLNQLLIVDRNAQAIQVLKEQQALGKKKIGIFYGAAHLPDLEQHLQSDLGLKRRRTQWLTAWDLTQAKEPELSEPAGLILNLLKSLEP